MDHPMPAKKSVLRTVILAGGRGTRLAEETDLRPKPMVEIGGHPILWHIMNIYAASGFGDFIISCGYKAAVIKDYFLHFYENNSDFTVDLNSGKRQMLSGESTNWRVSVIDTGLNTPTAGRILRLRNMLTEPRFCATY